MINLQLMFVAEVVNGNEDVYKNLVEKLVKTTQRQWKNYIKWIIKKRQAPDSHEYKNKNNHKNLIEIERLIKII